MIPSHSELPVRVSQQNVDRLEAVMAKPTSAPFDAAILAFLEALSKALLTQPAARAFPELVALGYWLRSTNLHQMAEGIAKKTATKKQQSVLKPLGVLVHFCPANVDTMFVYSWICSLLMGNNNIVRVSSRNTLLQQALMNILAELFSQREFFELGQRNLIVTWPHDDAITAKICRMVDGRVIWGGDDTINQIRAFPCQPRARDITFADRFSVSAINCDSLNESGIKALAELLWRDIKAYQQAACSSPRVLVWCGETLKWQSHLVKALSQLAQSEDSSPGRAMNHLVATQLVAIANPENKVQMRQGVTVQDIDCLSQEYLEWHPAEFLLYQYQVKSLNQLFKEVPSGCQTLSYYGFDKTTLEQAINEHNGKAVDRVVPVGQALNFSQTWDGYQLLRQFSRELTLDFV